jgi:hypothetical protein
MRTVLLICIVLFGFGFTIFSWQNSKFSGDRNLYPEELRDFMSNVSDQHEETLDRFIKAWKEDSLYSTLEQENIIRLSQKLETRKARPYPQFVEFVNCMLAFKEAEVSEQNYTNWIKAMDDFLDNKKNSPSKISAFLNFSNDLFRENAISKSSSTLWKATSTDYKIVVNDGIVIEFPKTDLKCFTRTDSIELFKTSGAVYPLENIWKGKTGLVTWQRGGYLPNEVFANLNDYTINLNKSEYEAENVVFTNSNYFAEPLEGTLNDKVKHIVSEDRATYPQFNSYKKTFYIENLYDGVNYSGGLSMQGAKMVGIGSSNNLARIFLYRNDTLVLEASSIYFGFKSDKVVSERTSITIKLKQDSIYHPDLFFDFRTNSRELILLKTDNFTSQGPYSNSYHKVEMNFDQLVWRIDEDYMRFTSAKGSTIGNAFFESTNYFNLIKYIDMQMMDNVHPLLSLRSFSKKFLNDVFPIQAYADYLGISVSQVKHLVMRMAYGGFVYYDSNTGLVTIKPRLHDYIAASVNKIDYDVIGFSSTVEAPLENAVFDLRNYDLIINGIPRIQVSDSQNVIIYPYNDRIILKENRNFQFDGAVEAGLITFQGRNLFFDYDSFRINMQSVDAVRLNFLTGDLDNYGLAAVGKINNMIQGLTGELLIDKPDNKSGRKNYSEYPIFKSKEKSYVYYNSPRTHGGVYDANDFYFSVDPFTMDSLDNFNAYSMVYEGEFVSAGILPSFREKLSLQEDYSLGFKHKTPEEGLPLFGGKGTFNNEIWLSNQGLRGNGTIKYITSTTWSDGFQFFPDSMNTLSQRFQIAKKLNETQYPQVLSENNKVHWEPYADVMWISKTDTDFGMFNDSTTLAGKLQLEPSGLTGWGKMDLKNSDLHSKLFTYKSDEILADTSDFYLKSLKKEGFTVLTENVNSHISYRQQKAWFRSNEGYSLVTFPENRYISYIDYFIWDMSKRELAMGSKPNPEVPDYTDEDSEPEGPRFISTDPSQDSLSFVSPLSFYDYENNLINATGVKFIDVADARIYPDQGLVTVKPDYKLMALEKSWLKANRFSKYHILHSATIYITGRKDYYGIGNYDYIDENNDKQIIHFKEIKVDSGMHTIANGEIFETANFHLSPAYKYQGKVFLHADDSLLNFKGATQIELVCDNLKPAWLSFQTRIDPNDIYIPIGPDPRDINEIKLFNSLFVYYDSVHVYPAFLSPRKAYSDRPMIQPEGFLYYNKAQSLYKIGSKEKINDFSLSEDYLSLHRNDCMLNGEGNIDLGNELGLVKLKNFGTIHHDLTENTTEIDLVMAMDFSMSEDMLNVMGREIDSFPNLQPVNLNNTVITKTMNAWVGVDKAKQLSDELNLFGTIKNIPPELKKTIILNELKLVWNNETNSYQSEGQIGIASINGIQINKLVDGFFELRIKRSGDIMDLYLQLDRKHYYYFGYTRGVMQTLSHNREYVETIMNMKPKVRKTKTPRGATPYNYLISTDRKKNNFYSRWQSILNNSEVIDTE